MELYVLKRYKRQYSRYSTENQVFGDLNQVGSFIKDLNIYQFITEIKVASTELFKLKFSKESKYLFDNLSLDEFLKDNSTLSRNTNEYQLLTINEVAELLKVTRPTVYKLVKAKELKAITILNRKRIRLREYLRYLSTLEE